MVLNYLKIKSSFFLLTILLMIVNQPQYLYAQNENNLENKKQYSQELISKTPFLISFQDIKNNNQSEQDKEKIVSYILNKYKRVSKQDARQIVDEAYNNALNHNLDVTLLLGLIEKESSFQKNIVSNMNAQGLMQVVPKYHQQKIKKVVNKNGGNLKTIENNVEIGTAILKKEINKYNSIPRALQAYNGNHKGTTYSKQVLKFQENIQKQIEM